MKLDLLLARQAIQRSAKLFLAHPARDLTYGQTEDEVGRLATFLKERGVGPGDLVHLMLPKRPEVVTAFLAVSRAGGIAVPVNIKLPPPSLRDFLISYPPRCLFLDATFYPVFREAVENQELSFDVVLVGDSGRPGTVPYSSALRSVWCEANSAGPDRAAYLNFTSGSTGVPRAAEATHDQICWNTRSVTEVFGFGEEDVHLPMFAVFAHPHEIFMRALWTGGTVVLHDHVYPRALAVVAAAHKVTAVMAVATVYQLLLAPLARKSWKELRVAESGGMATPRTLIDQFHALTGVWISPVWGSTESCGPAIATQPGEVYDDGIIGACCPHYSIKVVDDDGREVPSDVPGELLIAGPAVTERYWNEPEATQRQLSEGWYKSGDIVSQTQGGLYCFHGRARQVIKAGGLKVYAREVEDRIAEHPAVAACVVVADADGLRGEVHRALIAPEGDPDFVEKVLYPFLAERLPRYKLPRSISCVSQLPRLAGGKIDYHEALCLARTLAKEIGT